MDVIDIGGIAVGPGHPCRFVAEISNNHNGDAMRAAKLVEAASVAGAEFVKFQAFTPGELVALRGGGPAPEPWGSEGHSMESLYEMAQTPAQWFPQLFELAREMGLVPFASVFGMESLALMESLGCPAYKMAALDEGQGNLKSWLKMTGKPLLASTHGTEMVEGADLTLHCPPGYPQKEEEIEFGLFDGLSYHGREWGILAEAAHAGAYMVEAHFQLADEPSTLEEAVSLTEVEFWAAVVAAQ